jgi:predicted secreted acid phosphatase
LWSLNTVEEEIKRQSLEEYLNSLKSKKWIQRRILFFQSVEREREVRINNVNSCFQIVLCFV